MLLEKEEDIRETLGRNLKFKAHQRDDLHFSNVWILRKKKKNEILEFLLDLFLYLSCFNRTRCWRTRPPCIHGKNPCFRSYTWMEDGWHGLVRVNSCPLGQGQMAKIERFVAFRCFPATLLASIRLIEISTTRRRSLNRSLFVEPRIRETSLKNLAPTYIMH